MSGIKHFQFPPFLLFLILAENPRWRPSWMTSLPPAALQPVIFIPVFYFKVKYFRQIVTLQKAQAKASINSPPPSLVPVVAAIAKTSQRS